MIYQLDEFDKDKQRAEFNRQLRTRVWVPITPNEIVENVHQVTKKMLGSDVTAHVSPHRDANSPAGVYVYALRGTLSFFVPIDEEVTSEELNRQLNIDVNGISDLLEFMKKQNIDIYSSGLPGQRVGVAFSNTRENHLKRGARLLNFSWSDDLNEVKSLIVEKIKTFEDKIRTVAEHARSVGRSTKGLWVRPTKGDTDRLSLFDSHHSTELKEENLSDFFEKTAIRWRPFTNDKTAVLQKIVSAKKAGVDEKKMKITDGGPHDLIVARVITRDNRRRTVMFLYDGTSYLPVFKPSVGKMTIYRGAEPLAISYQAYTGGGYGAKTINTPLTRGDKRKIDLFLRGSADPDEEAKTEETEEVMREFRSSADQERLVFGSEAEALQRLADTTGQRVLVADLVSDEEAVELFKEDPVKNFDVLRNRKISRSVDLSYNKKITSLPEGLAVGGSFDLQYCNSLTSLPEGMVVGGWFDLSHCTSLASLPEGIRVGGGLYLGHCTSLTSLPEGLNVVCDLSLFGCASLTSLPEDFSVDGDIRLSNCTKLKVWLVKERKIEWLRRKVKGQIIGLLE